MVHQDFFLKTPVPQLSKEQTGKSIPAIMILCSASKPCDASYTRAMVIYGYQIFFVPTGKMEFRGSPLRYT